MLSKHPIIERNSMLLLILTVLVVSIGGMVEVLPLFRKETVIEPVKGVRPYTPLELAGKSIYMREGCFYCHSQQVRTLRDEVARYGHYSLAAESMYDHPFLWGSERTGPDLARVGGKYSSAWHAQHLVRPRDVVPESIMPPYAFLKTREVNFADIPKEMRALALLGTPYTPDMLAQATRDAVAQATQDADVRGLQMRYGKKVPLGDFDGDPNFVSEMDALIAYLQKLGTDIDFVPSNPEYLRAVSQGNAAVTP
jgi:cytochrome c oxidase cbb3-type subunit 2